MFTRGLYLRSAMFALVIAATPLSQAQDAVPDAAAAEAMASMGSSASPAMDSGVIQLQVGRSHVVRNVRRFEITNPAIADVQPTPEGDLIVNARSAGSTTLLIEKTGALGYFRYEVNVTGVDVENVLKAVKAALGGIVGLQIAQEGDVIVLQGDVANRDDGTRIDRQKAMHGNTILDLTRRTYLQAGLNLLKDELGKSQFRDITAETRLNAAGDEVLLLRGTVYSDAQREALLAMAGRFFDSSRVVDQIGVDSPQVEIDIEVHSFDLGRLRSLGNNTLLEQLTRITADGWTFQTGPRVPTHTLSYPAVTLASEVDQVLDAVNDINAVSNSSRQHASVRSGQSAQVDNIQEDNILIATGFAAELEQVTYGQTLTIQPTVLTDRKFETAVTIELSNRVGSSGTPSGSAVSVARRSMTSVFISEQGQTVVLGGNKLISSAKGENSTPFLAHVPIVNWWFRDKLNDNAETVQVFLMTLVSPEIMQAQEQAQSKEAMNIKARTSQNIDSNTEFLQRRQRWEAEGLHTLWTGDSQFE